jgi:phospholipase C
MRRVPVHCLGLLVVAGLAGASACSSGSSSTPDAGGHDAQAHDGGVHDASHADARKDTGKPADSGPSQDAGYGYTPPAAWNQSYTQPSDTASATNRAACKYTRGMMPSQTLGPSTPLDKDIPIEHIIVLMQENRSFDSYFGHLAAYEAGKGITNTIESAPATATNPAYPMNQPMADGGADAGVQTFPYTHAPALCFFDTNHSWGGAHIEFDKGLNDGFYFMNNGAGDTGEVTTGIEAGYLTGARALWWYDQRDLPFYYDLYSTFAMADHYHSALLGPTYPNRMYLYSATSFGQTSNVFPDISSYPFSPDGGAGNNPAIIFDELIERNISFALYTGNDPGAAVVLGLGTTLRYTANGMPFNPVKTDTQFFDDAKAGTLPAVAFLDADLGSTQDSFVTPGTDEHPPSEIEEGQAFVWSVVNAVMTGPEWKSTVLFITYDENGGIYDHVVPPAACEPDSIAPILTDALDQSQPGAFNQYGFRVPFLVVSPYAKKSYVSHNVYSHTSITRFIEAKEKLPALSNRDANEDPLTDLFDWQNPPFLTPPTFAQPSVNASAVTACTAELTAN